MHKRMRICWLILVILLISCTTSQERAADIPESVQLAAGQEATESETGSAEVELTDAEGTPTPTVPRPTRSPMPPTATSTRSPMPPTATSTRSPIPPTATPTRVPLSPTPEVITLPAGEPVKYARYLHHDIVSYGVLRDEETLWRVEGDIFAEHTVLAETVPLSEVQLLAPVQAGNLLAVGLNYASHAGAAVPAVPEMIPKLPNALAGPNDPIWMFPDASNLHYEAELVVVIGKEGRNIPLEQAASYVFGVTAGNDVSERNWQANDLQWIRAKSSDSFAPIGPYIVTNLDYNDLLVQSRINGELRQSESSALLIHNVETLISYISQYITLKPGDVIFTGTPGKTQAMEIGDVIEVEVEGVGVLRNTITARE